MSEIPRIGTRGATRQLVVDGEPYLVLGGELHNSSPSSPEYMAPIWDRLEAAGVRAVIGAASWQLVEPEEGRFDFTAVDDQVAQARARGIRLVLIWFGAYKNAESTYAPSWVRRDEERFPRAERDQENLIVGRFTLDGPILSVFSDELADADARAYAALLAHLAEIDHDHTVIAVQVENEVGLLGDSRDRSPLAEAAWNAQVPAALLRGLEGLGDELHPWVRGVWADAGARTEGTWEQVFGTGRAAHEIFMSWGFSRYVERVAAAGRSVHPLPAYANAWLGPQPNAQDPGQYPSGGPVARMLDVWRIGAPSLDFLAPDIYIEDFTGTLEQYARPGNPIFVPEARPEAALAFLALGEFSAIGFNPFGIEDVAVDSDLFAAYRVLGEMTGLILDAQAAGRIRGFRVRTGEQVRLGIGGFEAVVSGPFDTRGMFGEGTGEAADERVGYGLILQTDEDEFVVVARHCSVTFVRSDVTVEIDTLREGRFEAGTWLPRRTLNGDERHFMFLGAELRTVRISLLRRPAGAR